MSRDPRRILVSEGSCDSCSPNMIRVFHQSFPEMQIEDASLQLAVELLAVRLEADLDCIADRVHRDAVRDAIDDAHAFLEHEAAVH
jgi:DNA-binding transcriptional LysR family regulator